MSKQIRQLVLKRHILTIAVYIVSNMYTFMGLFVKLNPEHRAYYHIENWYVKILKLIFAAQGFFNPVLRLWEPYFYGIIGHKLRTWFRTSNLEQLRLETEEDGEFVRKANRFTARFSTILQEEGSVEVKGGPELFIPTPVPDNEDSIV